METIYYSLDAKRLTVCGVEEGRRASGGQETVCFAVAPRRRIAAPASAGTVLDFEACRRALERRAPEETAPARGPRPEKARPAPRRLEFWVDLCLSGAVLAVAAAVLVRFFSL